MQVEVINYTYDFNGNKTTPSSTLINAWRIIPSIKSIDFDGRQFLSAMVVYFLGDNSITKSSIVVIDGKQYEIIGIEKHYGIDSKVVHHVKVII